ncbi:MAG: nucleoside triphosphate pyrophosphohydrolase [Deltaproteobacteria bacterium]|nr:nucleoside triphosphate pyrophosphohydrolase [Deltaproteobacteria bacterium]
MHRLRSPGGCPWDAEQTHRSLRPYLLEEACEVLDAIDDGSDADLRDELGDLLLQVVFHAELAAERGAFTIGDVIAGLSAKLVRRHPHVFAETEVSSSADVERNWSAIKRAEREEAGVRAPSAIDGLPRALPALARAHRMGEKAANVGFDWDCAAGVRDKIDEELAEVDLALAGGDSAALEEEIGDLLFAVASFARLNAIQAESALTGALAKFDTRFRRLERHLSETGQSMRGLAAADLEALWQSLKKRA